MLEDVTDQHDVNLIKDQFGRTALHYAYMQSSKSSSQLIRTLVNAGCTEAVFDMVSQYIWFVSNSKLIWLYLNYFNV